MPKLAVQCLVEVKTYYSVVFFFTPKCISREKICSLSKTVNYLWKIDENIELHGVGLYIWDIKTTKVPKEIITKIVKNINEFYTKVH